MSWIASFHSRKWPFSWQSSRFERKEDAENCLSAMTDKRTDVVLKKVVKSKWKAEITKKMILGEEADPSVWDK